MRSTATGFDGLARVGARAWADRRGRRDARAARSPAACSPQESSLGAPFVLRGLSSSVVRGRVPADARHRVHAGAGAGRAEMRQVASRVDRVRPARAAGEVADGRRRCSPAALGSTGSTRCSRTCSSSTATRRPTVAGLVGRDRRGAQILGGLAAPRIRQAVQAPTSALILIAAAQLAHARADRAFESFWVVARAGRRVGAPVRGQHADPAVLLNGLIPSKQRATISRSTRSVLQRRRLGQPALGRAADVWGYGPVVPDQRRDLRAGRPFLALSRRERPRAPWTLQVPAAAQPGALTLLPAARTPK